MMVSHFGAPFVPAVLPVLEGKADEGGLAWDACRGLPLKWAGCLGLEHMQQPIHAARLYRCC